MVLCSFNWSRWTQNTEIYITEFKKWYATKNDVPNTAPSNKPSDNPNPNPTLPRDRKLWPEPKGNEPTQRVRNGKTHYFCSHHKWNNSHESDKCKFLVRKQNKTQTHDYEEIASKSLTIISAGQKWLQGWASRTDLLYNAIDNSQHIFHIQSNNMDPVVIDSGASHCYTNHDGDFIDEPKLLQNFTITGIGAIYPQ